MERQVTTINLSVVVIPSKIDYSLRKESNFRRISDVVLTGFFIVSSNDFSVL